MDTTLDKPDRPSAQAVAIDGVQIRSIREAKKLTQLYVASVVGVTTDTISRWENNRYPTIKRDNAEKLATALEVELAEILRRDEELPEAVAPEATPHEASPPARRPRLYLVLVALLVLGTTIFLSFRFLVTPPVAQRWLPGYAAPGGVIPVQIKVIRPTEGNRGFIVKETLPPGWRLVGALPAPTAGHGGEEVKWLVPGGAGAVTISYSVQVPPRLPLNGTATFGGQIVVHASGIARTEQVGGDRMIRIGGIHWADQNADGRIDDNEIMPAYYLSEEMKGMVGDWKTIEAIWSGAGYRWEPANGSFTVH